MRAEALPAPQLDQLSALIANRMGLHFPPERRPDLRRALNEAAAELGFEDGAACAQGLLTAPPSAAQLRTLAIHLTIGETYFFRERPSFNALATQVMPALIQRKRESGRRLRLWSAACSTGEEAYSLAILMQQLLPDWRDWNLSILATDINARFLRKAEQAVYGDWSFRESQPDFRERYFTPAGDRQYRVRPEVRELVKFAELNLAHDPYPSLTNDTNAIDLILCRNLLIYFTPTHARKLVAGLRDSLVDDGWLIVSPSECSQALFSGFTPVNFPGSILYRKGAKREPVATDLAPSYAWSGPAVAPLPLPAKAHVPQPEPPVAPVAAAETPDPVTVARDAAQQLYEQGRYGDAVTVLRDSLAGARGSSQDPRLLGLLSHALANQGDLPAALAASERWIAVEKLEPAAHYLNAMVLQELGERSRARAALQRAVYLQPEFTLAHFALGNCARAEARHAEAHRHFANAERLLRGHAADEVLPESEGLTAGRLREIITSLSAGADS
ncbi:MAG: CheR family methyltransferase [Pseudomonadota bacterium]